MGLEAAIIRRPRNRALVNFFKSIESLTDLNNIPKPCPYKTLINNLMFYCGVAERWIYIWLYKVYKNSSENGDMSNKKENPNIRIRVLD